MRNRHKFAFIMCCALADLIAMIMGTLIFLKFTLGDDASLNVLFVNKMIPITIFSWLLSVSYYQLYQVDVLFSLELFFRNSWRAFLMQRLLWYAYLFIFQNDILHFFKNTANLLELCFLLLYFLLSRIAFTLIISKIKGWIFKDYSVAIWGFNKTSIELASYLEANSFLINFLGIINENSTENYTNIEDFNIGLTQAIHDASNNKINELYIVSKPDFIVDLNYFFELGDKHCMRLKFVPDFSAISKKHFTSTHLNNFHVINPRNEPLLKTYNRFVKRIFDLVFSSFVIVFVLSWLYPLLAILIKRQSKGPVLFKQMRTGKKNKPFNCYKFRSMYLDVDNECQQATRGDSRVTPIGKFIRRTSLDELPQFYNVLMGDMSIVGPRPHMIQHTSDYNDHIHNFMVRHFVKPGITGLAQVSGLRGEIKDVSDIKRRVNRDIKYVQNWTIIADIKICFLTIIVTLKGDKNAF